MKSLRTLNTGTIALLLFCLAIIFGTLPSIAESANTINVVKTGSGTGAVTSSPAGIDCGNTCSSPSFPDLTDITLTATPDVSSSFVGWSGACTGTGNCILSGSNTVFDVTATFAINTYAVTAINGAGGTVSPSTQVVNYSGTASLTVTPDIGYHIASTTSTCGGSLAGDIFTTDAITTDCIVSVIFAINAYTVTPTADANGSISPSTAQTVTYGGTTQFTVTPGIGYHATVTGCGGTLVGGIYTTAPITADCSVTAAFAIDTFTITATAGANGSLSCIPDPVDYGGSSTCTAIPAAGYVVDTVTVDGSPAALTNGSYTFDNVTADHTIAVTYAVRPADEDFETGDLSKLPWITGGDGLWGVQNVVKHDGTYAAASPLLLDNQTSFLEVTVNVTTGDNIYFWYKVSSDAGDYLTFTIDAVEQGRVSGEVDWAYASFPVTVGLHTFRWEYTKDAAGAGGSDTGWLDNITFPPYALVSYTVTPTAGPNGSIAPGTAQSVYHGKDTTFTVTPDMGYHIDTVSGCGGTLTGNTYTTGAITADCTVTATFAINAYTVTPTAGANGTIAPNIPQTVNYNATTTFTVTPDIGYHIDTVSGCGGTLTDNTYTTGAITADCTVTAAFAINAYTVTPTADANGSISPSTAQTVTYGGTTQFTVTPGIGYHATVTGCGGTLVGGIYTTAPITADCSVTAAFAIDTFTITATAGANGSLSCIPDPVDYGGSSTCTAIPAAGYVVDTVTVDGSPAALTNGSYTFDNVTADHTIAVTYAVRPADEDFETGDLSKLPWITGGDGLWGVQNVVKHDGTYAAASPLLLDNQTSFIEVTVNVTTGDNIYFWYKVSSDAGDYLTFTIDAVEQGRVSGEVDWAYASFPVTVGLHTFRWEYTKDAAGAGGSDTGWLDNITFPPYALVSYTVTPTAGPNGSIAPGTAQSVYHGKDTTFTVTPDMGYHIDTVSGCGGTLTGNTYTTGAITADCTVTATFAINAYTVTPTAGANGTITPNIPQTVNYNATTTFTVTPDIGYHIDTVSGCGGTLTDNTYTTGAITADCTVTAAFAINAYTVTPTADANGSISPSTAQTVTYGGTTQFTVTPGIGYHATVTGCGGTLVGGIYTTAPITADCSVTAAFAIDTFTITATAGANGSLSCIPDPVDYGGSSTCTAIPAAGYVVDTVTVDGSPAALTNGSYTFDNVTADHTIAVTYAVRPADEDFETGDLSKLPWITGGDGLWGVQNVVKHDGTYAAASPLLLDNQTSFLEVTVNVTTGDNIYFWYKVSSDAGDYLTFTIDAVEQGRVSGEVDWAYASFPVTVGLHTFRWEYTKDATGAGGSDTGWLDNITFPPYALVSYTVTPTAGPNGSIAPGTAQSVYHGKDTTFTVTPDMGYHIDTVSGCGGTLAGNTYTTGAITADCTVTATFAINTYTVTPTAGANGTIAPNIPQTVNYNATTTFTVTPDIGYHIDTVSGCGGTLTGNTYTTGAITADCTVTAAFAINAYTVTPTAGPTEASARLLHRQSLTEARRSLR